MAWHVKTTGGYSQGSTEANENALEICSILRGRGWSDNAIAGVLGNMQYESGLNPWRWESDDVLSITDTYTIEHSTSHGYGLTQFTPAGKYIYSPYAQGYAEYAPNFSDHTGNATDGIAQTKFVDEHADYIPTTQFPMSYASFKVYTGTPYECANIWWKNYERSASPTFPTARGDSANYYYNLITGTPYFDEIPMYGYFLIKKRKKRGYYNI